ncbi:MAG: 16S rRNA (guanine(527)-N(7))-methyltransferase RsmG [Candidatus Ornithomonoglobus sp.]
MNDMIINGAEKLGISLTEAQAASLVRYNNILIERNKVVNLTRITEPEEVVTKHFLDSLTPLLTDRVNGRVIDVGTGAGFPGLVLKCARPEIELTLLDSLNKRITFLKDAAAEMGITDGIEFIHSRAEDAALSPEHRERYDTVVSRAVANMRTLAEWCLPFVKPGGYLLALKGPLALSELDDARAAIEVLGGSVESVFSADIPFTELEHKIIVIKKLRHTPKQFPRKGKKATEIPVEKAYKKG